MYNLLDIKIKYSSENNNILKEFYLPVLSNSNRYDRAVGYFSSSILNEYIRSLSDFYNNKGKIRLIISPELSAEDLMVLKNTTEIEIDKVCRKIATENLLRLFEGDRKSNVDLFFNLIVSGVLEVKIAIVKSGLGIFHEKYGLFYENEGDNIIAINGSNNETYKGIGINQESFNTFCSWVIGQDVYVKQHISDFEKYWNNDSQKLRIFDVNKSNFKEIFDNVQDIDVRKEFENLENQQNKSLDSAKNELLGLDFIPYPFQRDAAELLLEKKRGILKFATGSGKTKTAITYMQLLKKRSLKTFFVIVVPDKTLTHQWANELKLYNANVLTTFSDNPEWKLDLRRVVSMYNNSSSSNEVVVSTVQTMFKKDSYFLKEISKLDDFVLIADECHKLTTDLIMFNLPQNTERRVGLSATPTEEIPSLLEQQMLNYFEGVVAEYNLSDAIRDDKLCRYNYVPIIVQLEDDEKVEYNTLSQTIAKLASKMKENPNDAENRKNFELANYRRARVVYGAKQKISKLEEFIAAGKIERDYLLIYCGATSYINEDENELLTQLNVVNQLLTKMNIVSAQYTSSEDIKNRSNAIEFFEKGTISTLVAIKCLDEGVDIPLIRNAVILASSTSKREFVQRRGRVLRKAKGKDIVNIYDMVVRDFDNKESSLNHNETKRMIEFMSDANNKNDVYKNNSEYVDLVMKKESLKR